MLRAWWCGRRTTARSNACSKFKQVQLEYRAGKTAVTSKPNRLLGQGEHAFTHKTPGFREAALASYEKSLEIWALLGDRPRQASTLCHIGSIRYDLADLKTAAENYQRALELSDAEKDQAGQAAALLFPRAECGVGGSIHHAAG